MLRRVGLGVILLVGACEPDEPDTPAPLLPESYPDAFEEVRNCRFSVEHDAVYIRIVAEQPTAATYVDGTYPFAPGAVVVKEEFRDSACTEPTGFTVMKRLADGEAPDAGDWEYQRLDEAMVPIGPEDQRTCASCHQSCTMDRDGVCADP